MMYMYTGMAGVMGVCNIRLIPSLAICTADSSNHLQSFASIVDLIALNLVDKRR
jgi:hypothetical protein